MKCYIAYWLQVSPPDITAAVSCQCWHYPVAETSWNRFKSIDNKNSRKESKRKYKSVERGAYVERNSKLLRLSSIKSGQFNKIIIIIQTNYGLRWIHKINDISKLLEKVPFSGWYPPWPLTIRKSWNRSWKTAINNNLFMEMDNYLIHTYNIRVYCFSIEVVFVAAKSRFWMFR